MSCEERGSQAEHGGRLKGAEVREETGKGVTDGMPVEKGTVRSRVVDRGQSDCDKRPACRPAAGAGRAHRLGVIHLRATQAVLSRPRPTPPLSLLAAGRTVRWPGGAPRPVGWLLAMWCSAGGEGRHAACPLPAASARGPVSTIILPFPRSLLSRNVYMGLASCFSGRG